MQMSLEEYANFKSAKSSIKEIIVDMREELDQHLDTINQNTMELQANFDYLEDLDKRMDKIESKLDNLLELFSQKSVSSKPLLPLSSEEKEIYLALYTSQEPLSFEEISLRTNISSFMIEDFIQSLSLKNIPVITKTFAGKVFYMLEEKYKHSFAKEQVIELKVL